MTPGNLVCICGINRPGNFTSNALAGVADGRIGAIKSLEQMKGICSHLGAILVPGAVQSGGA